MVANRLIIFLSMAFVLLPISTLAGCEKPTSTSSHVYTMGDAGLIELPTKFTIVDESWHNGLGYGRLTLNFGLNKGHAFYISIIEHSAQDEIDNVKRQMETAITHGAESSERTINDHKWLLAHQTKSASAPGWQIIAQTNTKYIWILVPSAVSEAQVHKILNSFELTMDGKEKVSGMPCRKPHAA